MYKDLSLKEKSELFKLMVSNGITDINEIERIYNKYAEGGELEETPQQKIFNKSSIDDIPYTPPTHNYDWHNNWFKGREEILGNNYKEGIPWGQQSFTSQFISNKEIGKLLRKDYIERLSTLDESMSYAPSNKGKRAILNHRRKYNTPIDSITDSDRYFFDFTTRGAYFPGIHTAVYSKYITPSTGVHERTHALDASPQENLIYRHLKNKKEKGDYIKLDKYYDDSSEVYSRLMEIRYLNNIDPTKKWTIDEIKELKNTTKDANILNRYDDETLLFLFNDIAQNDTKSEHLNIAKNGGKVNKFSEGSNITLPEVVVSPRNSYYNYTGEETNIPTWEEFAIAKQEEARDNAYLKMLDQKVPLIPRVPSQDLWSKFINRSMKYWLNSSDEDVINVVGVEERPHTCAYTATGQYDKCNQVSGNITFKNNPRKYGFKETNTPRVGDLIQFSYNDIPYHMGMVTGFDANGEPVISYSNGDVDAEAMRHDMDTWKHDFDGADWKYFTFKGNNANSLKWRKEYKRKYKKK